MEPLLSTLPARTTHNEPHNLLARLYREIGISAVAAALQLSNVQAAGSHGVDAASDVQSPDMHLQDAVPLAAPADKAA